MFQFPPNPTPGQTYNPSAGITFRWNGTAWYLIAGPTSFLTEQQGDLRYVQIANARSMESRIINGNFAIDQRNAGAPLTFTGSASGYPVDRWLTLGIGSPGTLLAVGQGDTIAGDYRLALVASVADTDMSTGKYYAVQQAVEGVNVANLNLGTVQASSFTIAFEIQSTVAGTFCIHVGNAAQNRSYVAPFTISTGTTQKVITIPGDTTGTWERTNGKGMAVGFAFGVGTSLHTASPNTWVVGNFAGVAGMTNFMATANNTIYLKNFRLYPGSIDYGPCRRLYADELRLCQRYYWKSFQQGVVPAQNVGDASGGAIYFTATNGILAVGLVGGSYEFPVVMRAAPSMVTYNPTAANGNAQAIFGAAATCALTVTPADRGFQFYNQTITGGTTNPVIMQFHATASAEL